MDPGVEVLHKGASAWGISCKGDLDIYIPVSANYFDDYVKKFKKLFCEPGSLYPLEKLLWNKVIDGIEAEIFLVNKDTLWGKTVLHFGIILKIIHQP